ncbi:hypothetical protein H6G69_31950 [Nostoc sp. FACHB-110]|nr:hypothetical protein [Nostoc sp. FACHB-110]
MINVCRVIRCPYFGEQGHSYGCQRYAFSGGCHLKIIAPLQDNEYIVYTDNEELVNSLKVENDRFFLEDEKYSDDLRFQSENPDLFSERSFKVKEIKPN